MHVFPIASVVLVVLLAACGGGGALPAHEPHPLADLERAVVLVHGRPYVVWLATTPEEQAQGLAGLTEEDIAPLPGGVERGMLFVFAVDVQPSFTMAGTLVPLDLAFLRADGTIVETHVREPLDGTLVQPAEPVRYALELRGGVLAARGIASGDLVDLSCVRR